MNSPIDSAASMPPTSDQHKRIEKVINRIHGLPTLPSILENMNKMMANPRTSAKDVGKLVSNDPTITAKILRVVNSSFYGFPNRISTITHAVAILGFNTIRSVILSTTIFQAFTATQRSSDTWNRSEFWKHSIAVGSSAKVIAGKLGLSTMLEEFFIAGLLHDIGKIIIDQYLPEDFTEILNIVESKGCLLYDAEVEHFGVSHCEVGGLLTEKWGLSHLASAVVQHHHSPMDAGEYARDAAIVHVADVIARATQFGNGGDNRIPCIRDDAWELLGLTLGDLDVIMEFTARELEGAMVFMEFI